MGKPFLDLRIPSNPIIPGKEDILNSPVEIMDTEIWKKSIVLLSKTIMQEIE